MSAATAESTIERIGRALGRIPSGCSILTACSGMKRCGMLASWVQQAGFEPPMICVALKKGRPIETLIDVSGAFVVNLLGEDPSAMFKHFGKGFSLEDDAFAGLETHDVDGGVVIADQIGWMAAKVRGKHEAGDHWLYIAEVVEAGIEDVRPPYVHLRKSGLTY